MSALHFTTGYASYAQAFHTLHLTHNITLGTSYTRCISRQMRLSNVAFSTYRARLRLTAFDSPQVLIWLQDIGLPMYSSECGAWCKDGEHMLASSQNDVEKHLKIHNLLHRKKLRLTLEGEECKVKK